MNFSRVVPRVPTCTSILELLFPSALFSSSFFLLAIATVLSLGVVEKLVSASCIRSLYHELMADATDDAVLVILR